MGHQYDIIIDHHPVTDPVKADFLDIREDFGANASIMAEYLKAGKIKPSPKLATALFYGIKTDTDNFVRASIPHDMDAFKYLYQYISLRMLRKIELSEMGCVWHRIVEMILNPRRHPLNTENPTFDSFERCAI
jgi:nanoRNase/pAp phosphatase (c-di-AMP/oligoRNAs hydrolase)